MTTIYPGFETQRYKIKGFEQPFPNQLMVVLECPYVPDDHDILMPMEHFTQVLQKEGYIPPYTIAINNNNQQQQQR